MTWLMGSRRLMMILSQGSSRLTPAASSLIEPAIVAPPQLSGAARVLGLRGFSSGRSLRAVGWACRPAGASEFAARPVC
jgi:hypothetical protein